jgi:hypothetical protein
MRHFTIFTFLFSISALCSQTVIDTVYTLDKIEKSTSFATMTYGVDLLTLGKSSTTINGNNVNLPNQFMPRLNIGGLHFWGHADFYVTFPLGLSFGSKSAEVNKFRYKEGVETGAKVYPWAIKEGRIRPYIGTSFQPLEFSYELNRDEYKYGGSTYSKFITPIHLGVTYSSKSLLYNVGVRYTRNTDFEYYQSSTNTSSSQYSGLNINFSLFKTFDSSKSLATDHQVDQLNKKQFILKKESGLSSWYWAIGPSSALEMTKSSHFNKTLPFFNTEMNNSFLVPELAVGRYFFKGDFNVNAAFRYMHWNLSAFDTKVTMNRTSLALEGYKFLFDYHGFVPFVGPSVMIDKLNYNENGNVINQTKPAIGVVFGWDIRVSSTSSSVLRTNLRWTPNHHLKVNGEKVMFDHLEFNFIQYVHFIGRNNIYKKYSSKK